MDSNSDEGIDALTAIISALKRLSREDQQRTIQAVATFLGLAASSHGTGSRDLSGVEEKTSQAEHAPHSTHYSENRSLSAKEFLRDKSPQTDIERVVCLAYYLTHYRDVPHLKTLDISTLNTEAAQPKFSSASVAVDNAAKAGYLVPAVKGNKQLSAVGEHYVQLLPDRDAAKASLKSARSRKKGRKAPIRRTAKPKADGK